MVSPSKPDPRLVLSLLPFCLKHIWVLIPKPSPKSAFVWVTNKIRQSFGIAHPTFLFKDFSLPPSGPHFLLVPPWLCLPHLLGWFPRLVSPRLPLGSSVLRPFLSLSTLSPQVIMSQNSWLINCRHSDSSQICISTADHSLGPS